MQKRLAGRTEEYKRLGRESRAQLRADRQSCADEKVEEGTRALACGQAKDAFAHFRRLRAATVAVASLILDATGALISDKQCELQRWQEHLDQLLNRQPAVSFEELQQAASMAVEVPDISCKAPTEEEVIDCLRKLKNGKAPGCCNIAPEMLKAGRPAMAGWLTSLFQSIRSDSAILQDWKKGFILPNYKGKGSRRDCKNYHGITLSCPGKLLLIFYLQGLRTK